MDTGTSLILLPQDAFNKIIELINAQVDSTKQFVCVDKGTCKQFGAARSCSNYYHLDLLTFEFAFTKFNIGPRAYLLDTNGACYVGLTPADPMTML